MLENLKSMPFRSCGNNYQVAELKQYSSCTLAYEKEAYQASFFRVKCIVDGKPFAEKHGEDYNGEI